MKTTMRTIGKIMNAAVSILFTATLIVLVVAISLPQLLGGGTHTVLTGSMEPTINPGDAVVVLPVADGDVRMGDVVTFMPFPNDPTLVTHRVISVGTDADGTIYKTQGDANNTVDDPIKPEQVVGKVAFHIPHFGLAFDPIKQYQHLIGPLTMGMLIVYGIFHITTAPLPGRRKRRASRASHSPLTSNKETHDLPHRRDAPAAAVVR